jgi:hypothetical protein
MERISPECEKYFGIQERKIDSFFRKDNPLFLSPIARLVLYNVAPIILSRLTPVNTENLHS